MKEDLEYLYLRRQEPAKADNSHFPNNLLNRFDSMGRTENGTEETDDDAWFEVDSCGDANVDCRSHSSVRVSSEDENVHDKDSVALKNPDESKTLASTYGNRAAGMMIPCILIRPR